MKIEQCDDDAMQAWNAFTHTSPTASFYHRYEWRAINHRCFGHHSTYLAAFEGQQITGIFPLVQLKSLLFGNIACSMPFVNYGGPSAVDDATERALVDAAGRLVESWGADYLEIRSRRYLGDWLATSEHKVSMTLDLDSDPDKLWTAFKSNHRNEIRKGYKNGLTAKIGGAELIDDFYSVLSETWRDLGTPIFSKAYLETIAGAFPDAFRIAAVYHGDEPAAAAFDGLHGNTIEGMWMGTRAKYRNLFAGYVLYWELIKDGCERGFAHFHLGRSTAHSGGETFKKKWNAQTAQLYWHYVLRARQEMPQLNVSNPRFRLAIAAWQKLPIPLTQLVGPMIARSIP